MPTTVKDVAIAADVSVGTVSRVLSGEPNVADDILERVHKAIDDLGYSRLRRRKRAADDRKLARKNIAIALLGMDRSLVSLPSVACGIHGAESALSAAGANVLLSDLPRVDGVPSALGKQNIHGVLAKGALHGQLIESADRKLTERLKEIPTVWFLGRPRAASWGDVVESNDAEVGRVAADYLLERGHQRIAILDPKPDQVTLGQRCASFTWHATQHGAKVDNLFGDPGDWSLPLRPVGNVKLVDSLVGKMLKLRSRPTALFCPADSITAMVYRACARRGIQIGKDISVVSCNNELPLLTGLYPEVTTIDICAEQIGQQAVEQLIWRLENPAAPNVSVSVEPKLVEGMSVASV